MAEYDQIICRPHRPSFGGNMSVQTSLQTEAASCLFAFIRELDFQKMHSNPFSLLTGLFDHCMEILKTISDDKKAEAVKYMETALQGFDKKLVFENGIGPQFFLNGRPQVFC
jgi:hypothetical protein